MSLNWPFWLILVIPLLVAFWLRPMPNRVLTLVRGVAVLLLLLAICGLSVNLPSRHGCVVVVADRSMSMPAGSRRQQIEATDLLYHSMGGADELAVVSFGQRTSVEQPPQRMRFSDFVNDVGNEASNLADGVDRAVSLIPRGNPGRILILSDGYTTGGDVAAAAARAASSGIAIDFRAMQRSGAGDLAIERIDAPSSVAAAEAFMISAWVDSPRPQEVAYELVCGEQVLASGQRAVPAGRTRLVFRDKAGDAGARSYRLRVHSAGSDKEDPVIENNTARFLIGVRGAKPLLCVGPAASSLPQVLSAGGLKVDRRLPEQCHWSLAELAGFTGVLIEDVPAGKIGKIGMETLSVWITEAGGGLWTTGGRNSYGTGGYFKSALEPVLPVSMELRREHRKLSLAIVVALDRSGSMAVPVAGGRPKMELADLATCEVLNQMSGADQFGCLAVDSLAHEIIPLSDLAAKSEMQAKILKIDSLGGGIFIYEALEKAAGMIARATAGTRHIILFADAADSEEPGDYRTLLDNCTKAGVTVSVIGLGTERDSDAELLKDIAHRGGGQCMFTDDAHELPRLFAQDTFLVSRSTFVEDPTGVRTTAGMVMLSPQSWGELPQVGGYNLCYLRPGANLAAVTLDDYQAAVGGRLASGCRPRVVLHRRGRRQIHRPDRGLATGGRVFLLAGTVGQHSRPGPGARHAAHAGIARWHLPRSTPPGQRASGHAFQRVAAVDSAARKGGAQAGGRTVGAELDVGRHPFSRRTTRRWTDAVDERGGAGCRACGAFAHLPAVFAGIRLATGGGGATNLAANGSRDGRNRASQSGRHLERFTENAPDDTVGSVAAIGGHDPAAGRNFAVPHRPTDIPLGNPSPNHQKNGHGRAGGRGAHRSSNRAGRQAGTAEEHRGAAGCGTCARARRERGRPVQPGPRPGGPQNTALNKTVASGHCAVSRGDVRTTMHSGRGLRFPPLRVGRDACGCRTAATRIDRARQTCSVGCGFSTVPDIAASTCGRRAPRPGERRR